MTALGNKVTEFDGAFDLFKTPPGIKRITIRHEEFTSVCPVTGQPDTGVVEVVYEPQDSCIESKSFKLYMQSFRNRGVFCEALASEIAHTLSDALEATTVVVEVKQNPRGGVALEAIAAVIRPTPEEQEEQARAQAHRDRMQEAIEKIGNDLVRNMQRRRRRDHTTGETSDDSDEGEAGASPEGDEIKEATPEQVAQWWQRSGWQQTPQGIRRGVRVHVVGDDPGDPNYIDANRLSKAIADGDVQLAVSTDREGYIDHGRGVSFVRKQEEGNTDGSN